MSNDDEHRKHGDAETMDGDEAAAQAPAGEDRPDAAAPAAADPSAQPADAAPRAEAAAAPAAAPTGNGDGASNEQDMEEFKKALTDELQGSLDSLNSELDGVRREMMRERESMKRLKAELVTMRKRSAERLEFIKKYSLEGFLTKLLPIVDSLELGLAHADESGGSEGMREGMELTYKMFIDLLEKHHVTSLSPVGERFDPKFHEAISLREEEDGDGEEEWVVAVVQKGYLLHDRLVRPAKVVVARGGRQSGRS